MTALFLPEVYIEEIEFFPSLLFPPSSRLPAENVVLDHVVSVPSKVEASGSFFSREKKKN